MGSPSIPEPADAPDPSTNDDWIGVKPGCPRGETLAGHVHDRRDVETVHGPRVVIEVATGDGKVVQVPCFREHLRELVAVHDPRPADGLSLVYFGPNPGQKKELYGMRVAKSDSAEPSEAAKASQVLNAPLGEEVA